MVGFNTVSTAMVISQGEQGWELIQSLVIKPMRLSRRNLPPGSLPYSFQRMARGALCAMSHKQGSTMTFDKSVMVTLMERPGTDMAPLGCDTTSPDGEVTTVPLPTRTSP